MTRTPPHPGRRSFTRTVSVGLAGAATATAGATSTWAEATSRVTGVRTAAADGTDVAPLVLPMALVALAAWGTVLVLRRRGRRVVTVLAAVAGAVGVVTVLARRAAAPDVALELLGDLPEATTSTTAWPWFAALGCLVSAAAAVVACWRAPQWPEMSARYDAPTGGGDRTTAPPGETTADDDADPSGAELWKALDEGRDPTV